MIVALIISIALNDVTLSVPIFNNVTLSVSAGLAGLLCSILIFIVVCISNIYDSNRYKLNYTETEEQLTCCGEVGLLVLAGENDKKV